MKRLLIPLLMLLQAMALSAQGVPFLKNYTPQEYDAHNINFDLKTGADGTIYFANFEGVMYYDHATWNILYNSGITRVTVVGQAVTIILVASPRLKMVNSTCNG